MKYTLAKKLKDSGFPQEFRPFTSLDNGGEKDEMNSIGLL